MTVNFCCESNTFISVIIEYFCPIFPTEETKIQGK